MQWILNPDDDLQYKLGMIVCYTTTVDLQQICTSSTTRCVIYKIIFQVIPDYVLKPGHQGLRFRRRPWRLRATADLGSSVLKYQSLWLLLIF